MTDFLLQKRDQFATPNEKSTSKDVMLKFKIISVTTSSISSPYLYQDTDEIIPMRK